MRYRLAVLFVIASAASAPGQSGPCTQSTIRRGHVPVADQAFSFMPPYGKPAVGKDAINEADNKSFSDRTNIKSEWGDDHRIVSSGAGDMAYEYGTLHMSSDSKSNPATGREHFKAVMLIVYKATGAVCQQAALTMQPLEDKSEH
jgi:hypothetical protein